MAEHEIRISPKQARVFARIIYRDILPYTESHPAEYQQFLQQEEEKSNGDDKASH